MEQNNKKRYWYTHDESDTVFINEELDMESENSDGCLQEHREARDDEKDDEAGIEAFQAERRESYNRTIINSIKSGGFPPTIGIRFSYDNLVEIKRYVDEVLKNEQSVVIKDTLQEYYSVAILTRCSPDVFTRFNNATNGSI